MKSIELTEEHKSKLLEMCNKLFDLGDGVYTNFRFKPTHQFFLCKTKETENYIQWINDTNGKIEEIHWFEFCMTHLAEKILNPFPLNPSRGLQDKFKNFFWKTNLFAMGLDHTVNHPVDFLYEEFKKLKDTKQK